MKDLLNSITNVVRSLGNASGEQWLGFLCLSAFSFCMVIALIAMTSDHKIRCYYFETKATVAGLAYLVKSDVNWSEDLIAFSSPDPTETASFMKGELQCPARQETD